jgi:hypothetical protein
MLGRQGLSLDQFQHESALEQAAAATRRCLLCRDRATCSAWLDGHGRAPLCPNAEFIGRLKAATAG